MKSYQLFCWAIYEKDTTKSKFAELSDYNIVPTFEEAKTLGLQAMKKIKDDGFLPIAFVIKEIIEGKPLYEKCATWHFYSDGELKSKRTTDKNF